MLIIKTVFWGLADRLPTSVPPTIFILIFWVLTDLGPRVVEKGLQS